MFSLTKKNLRWLPLLAEYAVLKIFSPYPKNWVCREIFHCIERIFYHSGFLSNLRLSWKTEFALKFFTAGPIEYTFTFRIFEQLAPALKNSVSWIKWIEYIFFTIQDFWASCACPEKRVALKIFTVLIQFYHSGFLSKLRLPWKQSLPWIHCIEHVFFIIQDFWATCACPENRACPELTVLNRRATRGGAFGAFASPEIFKTLHGNFNIHRNFQRKMEVLILIIFKKSLIWILLCPTG